MSVQTAFPFGEPIQCGRARWGERKRMISSLRPGDPLIVNDEKTARIFATIARQGLGLRASIRVITRGKPEREFVILGVVP